MQRCFHFISFSFKYSLHSKYRRKKKQQKIAMIIMMMTMDDVIRYINISHSKRKNIKKAQIQIENRLMVHYEEACDTIFKSR